MAAEEGVEGYRHLKGIRHAYAEQTLGSGAPDTQRSDSELRIWEIS